MKKVVVDDGLPKERIVAASALAVPFAHGLTMFDIFALQDIANLKLRELEKREEECGEPQVDAMNLRLLESRLQKAIEAASLAYVQAMDARLAVQKMGKK